MRETTTSSGANGQETAAPSSSHCSTDLQTIRDWIHRNGQCPSDTEFWFAFCSLLNEWKEQRRDGMDVLASVALDEMSETIEAMRDL